ncbi:MAG: anhydro-N-acetylmuramic acid kinase [Acetobacterales bacterium]
MSDPARKYAAIGLMSGTSMDGVDAALILTDGDSISEVGPHMTRHYGSDLRVRLRSVIGRREPHVEVSGVEQALTEAHIRAVRTLLDKARRAARTVDLIGFHGHTMLHAPEERRTWQIGDAAWLAEATGIDVVADFRSADVAAGGQGAPLAPIMHAAITAGIPGPIAVLNVGGVANLTWIGEDRRLIAFDTGPGNALIDDWLQQRAGMRFDRGGGVAARGKADQVLVERWMSHPYFAALPPKSLDRDAFHDQVLADLDRSGMGLEDGCATLTAFTAYAVAIGRRFLPAPPHRWLVAGGGRHNATLMSMLRRALEAPTYPLERIGWDGDALEAQCFALLAVRSLQGKPITFPSTTGAPQAMTGGRLFPAPKEAG